MGHATGLTQEAKIRLGKAVEVQQRNNGDQPSQGGTRELTPPVWQCAGYSDAEGHGDAKNASGPQQGAQGPQQRDRVGQMLQHLIELDVVEVVAREV